MSLQIISSQAESSASIQLIGTVDTKTAPELLDILTKLDLKSLSLLKIDMSQMTFMSSVGLRALSLRSKKWTKILFLLSQEHVKELWILSKRQGFLKQLLFQRIE